MTEPLTLVITQGDPAGIGPEIVARAARLWPRPADCRLIVLGWAKHFAPERTKDSDASPPPVFMPWKDLLAREPEPGLFWAEAETVDPAESIDLGVGSPAAGRRALQCIELAVDAALEGGIDGIVTAPINKRTLGLAGSPYSGHTTLMAARSGAKRVAMMLAAGNLKVVLATIHEPLARVPGLLNTRDLIELFKLTHRAMSDFGIDQPKIGVAGLNPHAGEAGQFGHEEIEIIAPAIAAVCADGIDARGPFAADTIFHRAIEGEFDVVIAMYHDQGLIAIKTLDFYGGVNITLGLPFVRTSPDHGTAYDIAGKGIARPTSLLAALNSAWALTSQRRRTAALHR